MESKERLKIGVTPLGGGWSYSRSVSSAIALGRAVSFIKWNKGKLLPGNATDAH